MKTTFTSRGYKYHLITNPRTFGEMYMEHCGDLSDERIEECLIAECAPQKGLFKVKPSEPEELFFWFKHDANDSDVIEVCLDSVEALEPDIELKDAMFWYIDLAENFRYIRNQEKLKEV